MPRQEKSPKKKSKKSEEEDPAMDPAAINELVKNAIDQANAEAEQMKPITCHTDFTSELTELHSLVEGHLMDARAQGE